MRENVGWGGMLGDFFGDLLQHNLTKFGATVVCLLLFVFAAWLLEREAHLVKAGRLAQSGFFAGLGRMGVWVKNVWTGMASRAKDVKARGQEKKVAEEARRKMAVEQKKIADASALPKFATPDSPVPFLEPEGDSLEEGAEGETGDVPQQARTTIPTVNGAPKALFPKTTAASE